MLIGPSHDLVGALNDDFMEPPCPQDSDTQIGSSQMLTSRNSKIDGPSYCLIALNAKVPVDAF